MKVLFLGTGNAWGNNELSEDMLSRAVLESEDFRDKRFRTSLFLETENKGVLIDCGPDFANQRRKYNLRKIDDLLITHTHQDHIGGLDDLFPYKRSALDWKPIPTYAHKDAIEYLKNKKDLNFMFGSSNDNILEEKIVEPNKEYDLDSITITPFKTSHGKFAPGSVGYVIDEHNNKRLVYTSDFNGIESDKKVITDRRIDALIIESNWFNEPKNNPWGHMSFQNSLDYLQSWDPKEVYYIHFGDEDQINNDTMNILPVKLEPKEPLHFEIPKTHKEWDYTVREVFSEYSKLEKYCNQKDIISYDGLKFLL